MLFAAWKMLCNLLGIYHHLYAVPNDFKTAVKEEDDNSGSDGNIDDIDVPISNMQVFKAIPVLRS